MRHLHAHTCGMCGGGFTARSRTAQFCGRGCRDRAASRRMAGRPCPARVAGAQAYRRRQWAAVVGVQFGTLTARERELWICALKTGYHRGYVRGRKRAA